jgi:predicted glycosyl hydrolase (DUF1957 family)
VYRDFYRDVGWDLPEDALVPLVGPGRPRRATGFKYHRITGRGVDKAVWEPEPAFARAREHARHFVARVQERTGALAARMERDPLVVAPYDAELFGHWWFEGPAFSRLCFARPPPQDSRWSRRRTICRPGRRPRSSPRWRAAGASTATPRCGSTR